MREIKFRAWDEEEKEMVYFWLHGTDEGYHIRYGEMINEFPTMQFTGRLDKNGKEIYDRDIVLYDSIYNENEERYLIDWVLSGFQMSPIKSRLHIIKEIMVTCEVIGNAYENPELLEGQ